MSRRIALPASPYDRETIVQYVAGQLELFGGVGGELALLRVAIDAALGRLVEMTVRINAFRSNEFDPLHSLQNASLLYLAGHYAWRSQADARLVDRLFCLNKMISGAEIHPAVHLPGSFFLSHAVGAVLGAVTYGKDIVAFQHVTVGRIGDRKPVIGDRVVLFPGSSVTGESSVGDGAVISAGTRVHNVQIPGNSIARMKGGDLVAEPLDRDYHALYMQDAD